MNKLTYYILSAILSVLFFSSCSDDEKAVPAAATLNAIKVTSHSLEFSLTPQHADQCAWMCYKKGETAPTAEDILNEGIPADNSATSIQRAIALEAETCYIIQAAVVSQGRYLLSEALEMKTQPVYENDVPVVKLKLLEKASYRTDNEPGNGNYVIRLASGEIGKDDLPTNIGDYLVRLDLLFRLTFSMPHHCRNFVQYIIQSFADQHLRYQYEQYCISNSALLQHST